ncbi:ATP-binding cassette domain-containing protein [Desulfovibrio sp. OttesenSCG-928-G15]|nr:ATP-binding cassette domain-containing protein [Desulfovibrio sp. OttesenSCG-928-G15]
MSLVSSFTSGRKALRHKTPTILQMEATECGAASLGMVLAYHGRYEPLEKLREECGVSRNGSKATLLIKAARDYKLEAQGYRALTDQLDALSKPLILFWDFDHFLVYEGRCRKGKYYYLNDPASGPRTVDRELFEKSYTGVALEFTPGADFVKAGKPLGVFSAMLPMLRGMRSIMTAVIWAGLLLALPGLVIPSLMQIFVDRVLPGKGEWLIPILGLFILTMLLQILLGWLVSLALRRGQLQLGVNKTLEMMQYLFRLPLSFFLQRSNADIQTRVGLNSSVANAAFGTLANNIVALFTSAFFLALMFQFSPLLSLISLAFLVLDLLFLWFFNKRRQVLNQSLLMLHTKMLDSVMSGVAMMESLRAAGREDDVFIRWTGQMAAMNRKTLQFQIGGVYYNLLPTLLNGVGGVLTLCIGAHQIMTGAFTLGGMFAFQTLSSAFIAPFMNLITASAELQTMKADIERINDVYKYDAQDRFLPDESATGGQAEFQSLALQDICYGFSRHEPAIVENISLTLTPGRRVALVGASGSGKSTIAKLANGILTPWSGELLLNGAPLSSHSREDFYATVATVDQGVMLFSGTVGENLTLFAPTRDAQELQQAVRDAAIESELIARGPMLDLPVAEGGSNFSGGQRQRLEIARVLSRNTPVVILDEATSALDPVTEVEIDKALRRRGCACLVIAHRLSTIRDCDEIIMLECGRIVERGTHEALMQADGSYAQMMRAGKGA